MMIRTRGRRGHRRRPVTLKVMGRFAGDGHTWILTVFAAVALILSPRIAIGQEVDLISNARYIPGVFKDLTAIRKVIPALEERYFHHFTGEGLARVQVGVAETKAAPVLADSVLASGQSASSSGLANLIYISVAALLLVLAVVGFFLVRMRRLREQILPLPMQVLIGSSLDSRAQGIFVMDEVQRIVFANQSMQNMLDLSNGGITGKKAFVLKSTDGNGKLLSDTETPWGRALMEGVPQMGVSVGLKSVGSGNARFMADSSPLIDRSGALVGVFVSFNPVEKMIGGDESVPDSEQLNDEDSASHSDLLAQVNPALQASMNAISGYAEVLGRGVDIDSEASRNYIDALASRADQGVVLISDIIELSRIESGNAEIETTVFSPGSLIADVVNRMNGRVRDKGISVVRETESELPGLMISDPGMIRRILTNLISEAVQCSGKDDIAVVAETIPRSVPDLADGQSGAILAFSVHGAGSSLTENEVTRLINLIETEINTPQITGKGLGLSIYKRIAMAMGGDILIKREPGRGLVFKASVAVLVEEDPQKQELLAVLADLEAAEKKVVEAENQTMEECAARVEAEDKAKAELEARTRAEEEARAEATARQEAEANAEIEVEARKKAEAKFHDEVAERQAAEARIEEEIAARIRIENTAQSEVDARAEAEEKAKAEAIARNIAEASVSKEAEARQVAESKLAAATAAKEEAERKAEEESARRAEAERKAEGEGDDKSEAESMAEVDADAQKEADERANEEAQTRSMLESQLEEEAKLRAAAEQKAEAALQAQAEAEQRAKEESNARIEAENRAEAAEAARIAMEESRRDDDTAARDYTSLSDFQTNEDSTDDQPPLDEADRRAVLARFINRLAKLLETMEAAWEDQQLSEYPRICRWISKYARGFNFTALAEFADELNGFVERDELTEIPEQLRAIRGFYLGLDYDSLIEPVSLTESQPKEDEASMPVTPVAEVRQDSSSTIGASGTRWPVRSSLNVDNPTIRKLVMKSVASLKSQLVGMDAAFEAENYDGLLELSYRLRSEADNVKLHALIQPAKDLEEMVRSGQFNNAGERLAFLKDLSNRIELGPEIEIPADEEPKGETLDNQADTAAPKTQSTGGPIRSNLKLDNPKLRKQVENFIIGFGSRLTELHHAWEKDNLVEVARIAQWILRYSRVLGFDDFAQPAQELSEMAEGNALDQIPDKLEELRLLFARIED